MDIVICLNANFNGFDEFNVITKVDNKNQKEVDAVVKVCKIKVRQTFLLI